MLDVALAFKKACERERIHLMGYMLYFDYLPCYSQFQYDISMIEEVKRMNNFNLVREHEFATNICNWSESNQIDDIWLQVVTSEMQDRGLL